MEGKEEVIINRVTESSLTTIDLEELYVEGERILLDIAPVLYQGMVLREKDFRQWAKEHAWGDYAGKFVAITCSEDAVIPTWAYMLIATKLQPYARMFIFGTIEELESVLFRQELSKLQPENFRDAKLVIKGCSKKPVPVSAYVEISRLLSPYASSIMYGEPCSTVPIYKKPKIRG